MNEVLLDAGPIVALLNRSDRRHEACVAALNTSGTTLIPCEAVIVEACYILRGVAGAANDILANIQAGLFKAPYRLSERSSDVARLVKKYADTPMSLADACLVDLAAVRNTGRIITLDSDFSFYRWGRNQRFELVLDS